MRRHGFDLISFIFGVIFTGLGITFLSTEVSGFGVNSQWIWPIVFLVLGAGVLASAVTGLKTRRGTEEPEAEPGMLD